MSKTANKIINKLIEKEKELRELHSQLLLEPVPPKSFELSISILRTEAQADILKKILPKLIQIAKEEE